VLRHWLAVLLGLGLLALIVLLWVQYRDEVAQRTVSQQILDFGQARHAFEQTERGLVFSGPAEAREASKEVPASLREALGVLGHGAWLRDLEISQPEEAVKAHALLKQLVEMSEVTSVDGSSARSAQLPAIAAGLHEFQLNLDRMESQALANLLNLQNRQEHYLELILALCLVLMVATPMGIGLAKHRLVESIGALNRTQQGLQETNRLLSDLIEHSSSIISMRDLKGRFELVNRKWEEVTGLSRSTALQHSLEELFPGSAGLGYRAHDRQVLDSGQELEFEETFTIGKVERSFLSARFAVRGANGEIRGVCSIATDITERKRAMLELQERLELQEQLARIIATVPGAIYSFLLRPDGKTAMPYCSPVMEELWGLRVEDLRVDFASAFALVHPEDLPRLNRSISESASSLGIWHDIFRIRHPHHGERWIEAQSLPQRQADGSLLWHGFLQDVTERKLVEDRLRESEQRVRQVVESLPLLIWTCAADGPCDYLSPQWVSYTGLSEAEQLGYRWLEQIHPEDRDASIARWNQATATGENLEMEYRIRRHDGRYRWFRTLATPLRDDAGRVRKWFGTNTDINDLKQAEGALRQSEERLSFALRSGRIGAWSVNLRTRKASRTLIHARIFGYEDFDTPWTLDKFIGHVAPEERERVQKCIQEGVTTGHDWELECRIVRADGQLRWIVLAGGLERSASGPAEHISGIIQDITDRKQAESELALHVEELRKRNDELQRWGRATVNRELRMLELKQEVSRLREQLGQSAPHPAAKQ
jgi:PAS domain S-box-containing protein